MSCQEDYSVGEGKLTSLSLHKQKGKGVRRKEEM
jgi:hypothetical protein